MRHKIFFLVFLSLLSLALDSTANSYQTITVGRYTSVAATPSAAQINPLLAIAQFRFPATVRTVGQAVNMVLVNTGYQLAPNSKLSPSLKETLTKPLPITDRELGPLTIKDTLRVLVGKEVFTLVVDPLHRLVNFELKPAMAKALGVHHVR